MIGVLLLTFGGPATLDEVELFLTSVMSGRKLTAEQLEKVKEKYKLIGGSPLPGITFNQAKLLEERLNRENKDFHGMNQGDSYRVYVGFRHSHPTIEETVNRIVKDEIKNIVVLSLAPYYSKVTTAGYIVELERVIKKNQANFKITVARHLATHPLYLECIVEKIEQGLKNFPAEERNEVQIIFSVHSIPQKFIDKGDPYLDQVKASIDGIIKISGLSNWRLAFQSRGLSEEKWLEPDIKNIIDELAKGGIKNILLVPLSFVCDNIETLYDIDIIYKKYAEKKGLNFVRSSCFNTSPKFIEALAAIVKESL